MSVTHLSYRIPEYMQDIPKDAFSNTVNNAMYYTTYNPNEVTSDNVDSTDDSDSIEQTVEDSLLGGGIMLSEAVNVAGSLKQAAVSRVLADQASGDDQLQKSLSMQVRGPSAKDGRCAILLTKSSDSVNLRGSSWMIEAEKEADSMIFEHFSLTSVNESEAERYAITETAMLNVLYLFDKKPRLWSYSGKIVNGRIFTGIPQAQQDKYNLDWKNELQSKYQEHYRGTKAVESNKYVYMVYEDTIVKGVLLKMSMTFNAKNPAAANVSFIVYVLDHSYLQVNDSGTLDTYTDVKDVPVEETSKKTPVTPEEAQASSNATESALSDNQAIINATESSIDDMSKKSNEIDNNIKSIEQDINDYQERLNYLNQLENKTPEEVKEAQVIMDQMNQLELDKGQLTGDKTALEANIKVSQELIKEINIDDLVTKANYGKVSASQTNAAINNKGVLGIVEIHKSEAN